MGRGQVGCRINFKRRGRSKDKGSDDSDEDYVVSDEVDQASDGDLEDYCSSSDGDASEEIFCGLVEEEVEFEDRRVGKVRRPRSKKGNLGHKAIRGIKKNRASYDDVEKYKSYEEDEMEEEKRTRKVGRPKAKADILGSNGIGEIRSGKRNGVLYDEDDDYEGGGEEEEEEEEELEDVDYEDDDDEVETEEETWSRKGARPKAKRSSLGGRGHMGVAYVKRDKQKEDSDYEEEDEYEDDEEFTPDDDVSLDDEEELLVDYKKKNSVKKRRRVMRKRKSGEGSKRRKKAAASKETSRNRSKKRQVGKKKTYNGEDDGDFVHTTYFARKKTKKKTIARKSRYYVPSDSDFVSSGSSDHEYTISEEEREQLIEASNFCRRLRTSSRSLSSSKKTQDGEESHRSSKPLVRKGKEKIEEMKSEIEKRVCGICLSDEDKRRLRGTLDCCTHYFCFTCIMEWSKVESRCPLCKQRFKTISKAARSAAGLDLRDVILVPERDQVYQPTEEELRSYLDPYENVICTECHQGGDDGLMLLCDLCDSSAHTYCVGLGHEVPEGNWYCGGCRPIAQGSSSTQAPGAPPDQTMASNHRSPLVTNSLDWLDPTLLASPRTPFLHGFGNLSSPRFPNSDIPGASPSGAGAPTLSRRRSLHRHIHNLLSMNRTSTMAGRNEAANSSNGFFNPQQNREIAIQPARTQETRAPLNTVFEESVQQNPLSSALARDLFTSRLDHVRRETVRDPTTTVVNGPLNLTLWPDLAVISPVPNCEQTQQAGSYGSVFSMGLRTDFSLAKEQLQMTVETHLKNLSRRIDLGQGTFNDIAKCSTHTILAACGLEHKSNEVDVVPPPVTCSHAGASSVADQTNKSLMKGCCSSCFDSFVKDVVKMIMDTRLPQWLSLGL